MRHVVIWDGLDGDGRPQLAPDHPRLDERERTAVAAYLASGAVVLATTERVPDVLSPSPSRPVVPLNFRTDGEWVWSDEVTYYVSRHGLAPHEPFLHHVRACGYRGREPDQAQVRAALAFLTAEAPPSA